ncbi:MAG: thioesterase [Magnetococcales bacterium]|nr:thioesterase [Magnetococcales bacterium]
MIELFCIPFAGGNVYSYQRLAKHVPGHIKVTPLEPPGRGRRSREALLYTIRAMTDDLLAQIQAKAAGAYALYGHSLGAYLGYMAAQRLVAEQATPPRHLFISGSAGPSFPRTKAHIHHLAKNAFLAEVDRYGGLPKEILAHKEMIDYFEPILRADFQAIETNVHRPLAPLDIPMTVMAGSQDRIVPPDHARLWQKESRRPFTFEVFPGEHFFIFEHWPRIGEIMAKTLQDPSDPMVAPSLPDDPPQAGPIM